MYLCLVMARGKKEDIYHCGVATLIAATIKKCVEIKVKSSFCQACASNNLKKGTPHYATWKANHESECSKNHSRSELQHDLPLDKNVAKHILPIYEVLSEDSLLERRLGGYTQNANESLNSIIWKFAPKHLHSGLEIVEIAAYLGGSIFNEGFLAILWIMQDLQIEIGERSFEFDDFVNKCRDKKSKVRRSQSTREARKTRKEALLDEEGEEHTVDDMM